MAEHKALLKCANGLSDLLQHDVVSISSQLLETGLVTKEVHDWVLTALGVSNKQKAARLVSCVADQVKASSEKYDLFIDLLKKEPALQDAVEILSSKDLGCDIADCQGSVGTRINELECQFRSLRENILSELESKKVPVRKILDSLTSLPIDLRNQYKKKISKKLHDLRKEEEVSDLFLYINPLVNFIDYGLIKYMIDQHGSNTLKRLMISYSDDVVVFMKKTTVKDLMDLNWPGKQKIPEDFSNLWAKIDDTPTTFTLYELDQLRRRFYSKAKLVNVVSIIVGLDEANSFIVQWLFPSALVPQLIEVAKEIDFAFFLRERILKMVVDEKQIFPFLPDSKPKVPTLQAATTSVTDLKDDEGEQAIKQLSSSMEQLRLSKEEDDDVRRIREKLSDCALYSGMGIVLFNWGVSSWETEALSTLNFKHILVDPSHFSLAGIKMLFCAIAQFRGYPGPPTAGSPPFVITFFVSGINYHRADSLLLGDDQVDIVKDIIKPFLPQSAPHLVHIPKLFFISSYCRSKVLRTQPPLFPDDPDANYCIVYYMTAPPHYINKWWQHIIHNLTTGQSVQETIENIQSSLGHDYEHLHYFSSLKDSNLVLSK